MVKIRKENSLMWQRDGEEEKKKKKKKEKENKI